VGPSGGVVELADTRDLVLVTQVLGFKSSAAPVPPSVMALLQIGISVMQITEPSPNRCVAIHDRRGLKDLDEKLTGKITEMQPRIHLKGFRPASPVSFLKKLPKISDGEIVNDAINRSSEQLLKERR